MADAEWEFRYVIDHLPNPGQPKWSDWETVTETGTGDGKMPNGHDVDAMSGCAKVQFRRKPRKCRAWINLLSLYDSPPYDLPLAAGVSSHRLYCDIPAGEPHPTITDDRNAAEMEYQFVHRAKTIWWASRSIPEDNDD